MSYNRLIRSSDGEPITSPTTISTSASGLVVYANDAAYESANGAGSQGDVYLNSTSNAIRRYTTSWGNMVDESAAIVWALVL